MGGRRRGPSHAHDLGRITVHMIARTGSQIEIAETIPGFDELAAMLRRPWLRLAA